MTINYYNIHEMSKHYLFFRHQGHIISEKKAKHFGLIYVQNKPVKKIGMQTLELVLYLYFNVVYITRKLKFKKGVVLHSKQTDAFGFKPINCHVATKPP